jgi:hypothetical protein
MYTLLDNRYKNINMLQRCFFWSLYRVQSILKIFKKKLKQIIS